jgi:hypothetical protein
MWWCPSATLDLCSHVVLLESLDFLEELHGIVVEPADELVDPGSDPDGGGQILPRTRIQVLGRQVGRRPCCSLRSELESLSSDNV